MRGGELDAKFREAFPLTSSLKGRGNPDTLGKLDAAGTNSGTAGKIVRLGLASLVVPHGKAYRPLDISAVLTAFSGDAADTIYRNTIRDTSLTKLKGFRGDDKLQAPRKPRRNIKEKDELGRGYIDIVKEAVKSIGQIDIMLSITHSNSNDLRTTGTDTEILGSYVKNIEVDFNLFVKTQVPEAKVDYLLANTDWQDTDDNEELIGFSQRLSIYGKSLSLLMNASPDKSIKDLEKEITVPETVPDTAKDGTLDKLETPVEYGGFQIQAAPGSTIANTDGISINLTTGTLEWVPIKALSEGTENLAEYKAVTGRENTIAVNNEVVHSEAVRRFAKDMDYAPVRERLMRLFDEAGLSKPSRNDMSLNRLKSGKYEPPEAIREDFYRVIEEAKVDVDARVGSIDYEEDEIDHTNKFLMTANSLTMYTYTNSKGEQIVHSYERHRPITALGILDAMKKDEQGWISMVYAFGTFMADAGLNTEPVNWINAEDYSYLLGPDGDIGTLREAAANRGYYQGWSGISEGLNNLNNKLLDRLAGRRDGGRTFVYGEDEAMQRLFAWTDDLD